MLFAAGGLACPADTLRCVFCARSRKISKINYVELGKLKLKNCVVFRLVLCVSLSSIYVFLGCALSSIYIFLA